MRTGCSLEASAAQGERRLPRPNPKLSELAEVIMGFLPNLCTKPGGSLGCAFTL